MNLRTTLRAIVLVLASGSVAFAATKLSFADLLANLKSPTAKTRQEAAAALGKSHRREAVAPLAALVRDPEPKVRLEVVHALRELRDLSAVPALVTSMQDGDPPIREEAIGALVQVYAERDENAPLDRFLQAFSDEYDRASVPPYTRVEPTVFQALATALTDEQRSIREDAAYAMGILDGHTEMRALTAALADPEPKVRAAAATSIGKIGSTADGRSLIPLLADDSMDVRNRVLQALGVLRVREAGPALREMYEANRRKEFGLRALGCLSRIADPAQADLFRDLLQDTDPDRRRVAVEGLARVSDTSLLGAFKKDYQRERSDEMKLAYTFAITLLGDHAFLDSLVLNLSSKAFGKRARSYILELGAPIVPELYPYLNDQDAEIRVGLCDLIAQLGNPDAIGHLQPLLSDPNTTVADRANRAVERLKGANPSPEGRRR